MTKYKIFTDNLKKDWVIQGFGAVPLFLNLTAYSGIEMKEKLGFGHSLFMHHYKEKYCEMYYLKSDFIKIWKIVKKKLSKDKKYLEKIRDKYFSDFNSYKVLLYKINKLNLKNLSDEELLDVFINTAKAQIASAGTAHIIEAVSFGVENELKKELLNKLKKSNQFNTYYNILTSPTILSFVAKEENELFKLKKNKQKKLENALQKHIKKYFWIQNNYEGPRNLDVKYFKNRLNKINNTYSTSKITSNKNKLIKKLNLTKKLIQKIELADFCTSWQDKRKANILMMIGYFGIVIKEVSKRTNIEVKYLHHMGVEDVLKLKNLNNIKKMKIKLIERVKESFFLERLKNEIVITGKEVTRIIKFKNKLENKNKTHIVDNILHGSIANNGTAIGKVKICKNLSHIHKVNKGNILVAPMTRPEYMPALKKAAAIITDQGGITCHAAIVSRELDIPAIIGTKVATKILKDGDLVEVDADKGIVRKI